MPPVAGGVLWMMEGGLQSLYSWLCAIQQFFPPLDYRKQSWFRFLRVRGGVIWVTCTLKVLSAGLGCKWEQNLLSVWGKYLQDTFSPAAIWKMPSFCIITWKAWNINIILIATAAHWKPTLKSHQSARNTDMSPNFQLAWHFLPSFLAVHAYYFAVYSRALMITLDWKTDSS